MMMLSQNGASPQLSLVIFPSHLVRQWATELCKVITTSMSLKLATIDLFNTTNDEVEHRNNQII